MALSDFLVDRMDIEALKAPAKDKIAGPLPAYEPLAAAVPCQIHELSAGQRVQAALANMAVSHEILTAYPHVEQGLRLRLRLPDTGAYVRVLGVQRVRAQGSAPAYYCVTGEEVRDGA